MSTPMLSGLFDRPIVTGGVTTGGINASSSNLPLRLQTPTQVAAVDQLSSGYTCDTEADNPTCANNAFGVCDPGYQMDITGFCVPIIGYNESGGGGGSSSSLPITPSTSTTGTSITGGGTANVIVNNSVDVTDQGIQQVAEAVNDAIQEGINNTQGITDALAKSVQNSVQESTDQIDAGIQAATTNLGNEVTITSTAIAATTAATIGAIGASTNSLLDSIKSTITPILASINSVINSLNADVQAIYSSFLEPLLTLYNSTVGTIATLTASIEQDLKDGISGLLLIPGQLADELASFDASLNRTVQQLGAQNLSTVTSGIDYGNQTSPPLYSAAFQSALGGAVLPDKLKTTFSGDVAISSESLQQVSNEAISGLGTLLHDMANIISGTFATTTNQLHSDWASVDSVFVGLLDGLLGLLTTITSMGAIVQPLIKAAEQSANALVPTTKLDPATIIEAMNRQFLSNQDGLAELASHGYDSTRSQVLSDLTVFLADVNQALDWWYRGIIADSDLAANMASHNININDAAAIQAASINLPSIQDLQRWLNFGIINQDEFTTNATILRYDTAQIQAILATYQTPTSPEVLIALDGLVNNSSADWFGGILTTPIPESVITAGQKAGYAPDLIQYMWVSHWEMPSVEQFIHAYFRGIRTAAELQSRLSIANIPPSLQDDFIEVSRPTIPLFILDTLGKSGAITPEAMQAKLAYLGYNLADQEMILKAVIPATTTGTGTAVAKVATLSISNARELWGEGGLTDDQYIAILEAHGYTADTAALQLKADAITEQIKLQKEVLADFTAQVEAGITTMDQAISSLISQGFSPSQITQFQTKVIKATTAKTKHPSISDMNKFVEAGAITLDQYKSELQLQGWIDPWLSAWIAIAPPSPGSVIASS